VRIPAAILSYRGRIDPYLVVPAAVLVVVGCLAVYSATEFADSARAGFFARHLLSLAAALAAMLIAMAVPLRLLEDLAYGLYGLAILLLIAVLIVGTEVYGARRWLGAGPLRIQPSELAKVACAIAVARFLVARRRDPGRIGHLLIALGLVALPLLLVLKEPDLGTSGAFAAMGLAVLVWAGLPWLHLLILVSPLVGLALCRHSVLWGLFLLGSVIALWRSRLPWLLVGLFVAVQIGVFFGAPRVWNALEPYQRARLTTFLDPSRDPAGAGYQILQSKIAIGSGEIVGKGYLQGSQKALAFLPQQHTDFIFSVLGEEFGFVGAAIVVLLFFALVSRGYYLALHCRNSFSGALSVALSTLLLYHAGVNMAMTVGLLPVTGLPLPLVSYGGSFLVSVFAMLGLLLNISAHRFDY